LIADFCVLANGVYLALAWVSGDPTLDTPRILALPGAAGWPGWVVLYCGVTMGLGYVRFRADVRRVVRAR
jgi:hypothetical protein